MKIPRLVFFIIGIIAPIFVSAQGVEEIIRKYEAAISQIQSISYDVRQLDTFVTGHVWDHTGRVTLIREEEDTLFGFRFSAFKEAPTYTTLYTDRQSFDIDHGSNTFEINDRPRKYILGAPGGQLIVSDMLVYEESVVPTLSFEEDQYVLIHRYPDPDPNEANYTDKLKVIYLDKQTYLPSKVVSSMISLGKKQVITRFMEQIRINLPEHEQAFDKDFLADFEPVNRKQGKPAYEKLIDTQARDFLLEDYAGDETSMMGKEGQVLLLDFWEVWCGPCIKSMPEVQALHDKYAAKGLRTIGIMLDKDSRDSAQMLLDKKGVTFAQLVGNQDLKTYFEVSGIPQYVLIDQTGKIRYIYQGYQEGMEDRVRELLNL